LLDVQLRLEYNRRQEVRKMFRIRCPDGKHVGPIVQHGWDGQECSACGHSVYETDREYEAALAAHVLAQRTESGEEKRRRRIAELEAQVRRGS
jgi:hypothetical protein